MGFLANYFIVHFATSQQSALFKAVCTLGFRGLFSRKFFFFSPSQILVQFLNHSLLKASTISSGSSETIFGLKSLKNNYKQVFPFVMFIFKKLLSFSSFQLSTSYLPGTVIFAKDLMLNT